MTRKSTRHSASHPAGALCVIAVDMGTTHTRVWLMRGDSVIARVRARLGIQDAARAGSSKPLREGLRDLLAQVRGKAARNGSTDAPACVVAAGMITSSLGLLEVPHIEAPAGRDQLSAAIRTRRFPEIIGVPFLFVPGVRCGTNRQRVHRQSKIVNPAAADMMRGEETLCIGLAASGDLEPPGTVLNLGSHWKAIRVDEQGRVASSVTSLAGELIEAAKTQTILAGSLPRQWPAQFDRQWIEAGMSEQRRSGLARALFCVRLHDQLGRSTADERFAFLIGAFIAADFDGLSGQIPTSTTRVVMAGHPALAAAWQCALEQASISARVLSPAEVERGFLQGLRELASLRQQNQ